MMRNLIALFSLGLCMPAMAVNVLSTNFDPHKYDLGRDSILSGDFGYTSNELVQDVGNVPGNRSFGFLNFKYQSADSSNTYKGFEVVSKVNDQQVLEYSIKEALLEFRYSRSRVALGRTNLEWSHVDKIWGLGKVNNRINFNHFEPGQEGLVGVFYDEKLSNGFNIGLFGSLVYVPEMSQGMVVDNSKGTIECRTAWCDAPSPSARIDNRDVPIYYNVNYPDVEDVVFKPSFGMQMGYSYEKFHMNAFYLKKPENEISVLAEIVVEPDVSQIDVDVTPQFYYHDVKGGNLELQVTDNLKIFGSGISTIPNKYPTGDNPYIQYTGIKPKKKREDYLSGGAAYSNGDLKVQLGYIARVSEFDTESDILVNYPRWNQAAHFSFSKYFSRKIFVALDHKYDMLTEDRLTMFKTSYSFGPSVVASLGVNVIGTNPSEESFWTKFENNDSVYSSLKYTF